jgi:hypothetical protein
MEIEIYTQDRSLFSELMGGKKKVGPDTFIALEDGTKIYFRGILSKRALNIQDALMFAVEFGSGVGTGLFTAWLYEKLKGRATN